MKDKRGPKKLVLNRETLRNLTGEELKSVAGGGISWGCTDSMVCSKTMCSAECVTADCQTDQCGGSIVCATIGCLSTPAQTCGDTCGYTCMTCPS